MLTLESNDINFIDINKIHSYDSNGFPSIGVTFEPGPWKTITDARIMDLEIKLAQALEKEQKELELIAKTPALKDLYDKYRVMLALVKEQK